MGGLSDQRPREFRVQGGTYLDSQWQVTPSTSLTATRLSRCSALMGPWALWRSYLAARPIALSSPSAPTKAGPHTALSTFRGPALSLRACELEILTEAMFTRY